jgi:hypothetical protein
MHEKGTLMEKSVVEAHPLLYHYTTAEGPEGIVSSQQLWATNIHYLNDAEEHTGFFERRLPYLVDRAIRAAVFEIAKTPPVQTEINVEEVVKKETKDTVNDIRDSTLRFNEPYVTSFCSPSCQHERDNGLLSQWRGYGADGGYAIVFETQGLQKLLDDEGESFGYQFAMWGDVEYYDSDTDENARHSETQRQESIVHDTIRDIQCRTNPKHSDYEPLYIPISWLACSHKHRGFAEEKEVRIVAVPWNTEVEEEHRKIGDNQPRKTVDFRIGNGTPVPYIKLFGRQSSGKTIHLPISRVIVGPHPEKLKRQQAVALLLKQYGVKANLTVSDIPYLGR